MEMRKITPGELPVKDMHQFIIGSVAPRPIAFVSTLNSKGVANLAPFSFFNAFSSNPPVLVFSANRRVRDNTTKHSLHNVQEMRECVVNVVSYDIVRQMAVSSIEWPEDVSEFDKTGLTPIASELVMPFRVKESPVHFECKVDEIVPLGEHGGAGHLIICKVLCMHVAEEVIDERNRIDPHKIDLMGRMGRAYYVRASGSAIHTIVQPFNEKTIGYDGLPEGIRLSPVLTGNHLGMLAGMTRFPDEAFHQQLLEDHTLQLLLEDPEGRIKLHRLAGDALDKGQREYAAAVLQLAEKIKDQE